ncbi:hypothetical protein GCM10025768_03900 [Microbacterium pseudoresistens]
MLVGMSDPQHPAPESSPPSTPTGGHDVPSAPTAPPSAPAAPAATPSGYPSAASSASPSAPAAPFGSPAPYGVTPRTANTGDGAGLARTAAIIAIATLALGLVLSLIARMLISTAGFGVYEVVFMVQNVLSFIGYVAAFVLGLIAARRTGGKLFAGIAIGIGGAGLLSIIVNQALWLFQGLFF